LLREDTIAGLLRTVRHAGHKVTQPRRMVIETLVDQTEHLTAPSIVEAVRQRAPDVGRASVYRTLDLLTRLGLVQTSTLGGAAATYKLCPHGHHHHLVCIQCHKIIEFDDCVVGELERQLTAALGFEIEGHLLELYGRCPDCLS
jgi:Fur family ferric uptake transcriptional regulator